MHVLSLLRRLFDIATTTVLVTAVAAFVWLYAEQRTVLEQKKLEFEVDYGTPEQQRDLFILVPPTAPRKVTVTFKSSNTVADAIRAQIDRQTADGTPFHLPLPALRPEDDAQKPEVEVSVRECLEKTLFLGTATSNIQVEQNPQVKVEVERIKTIKLPLEVEASQIEKNGTVDWDNPPTSVSVSLPARSIAASWEKRNDPVKAVARLDKSSLANIKLGEKTVRQVPVEIPALEIYCNQNPHMKAEILRHLVVAPATLGVTLTLNETINEDLLIGRSVPITISAPPTVLNNWAFAIPADDDRFIKGLSLTCTQDAKKRIVESEKDAESPKVVWAVVRVTTDTIPSNGILTLQPEVMLPAGAAVSPTFILPKTITVKATRRNP